MMTRLNRQPSAGMICILVLALATSLPAPSEIQLEQPVLAPVVNKLNMHFTTLDLFTPSHDLPLQFTRSYNSNEADIASPIGFGWTHSYNMRLTEERKDIIVFANAIGKKFGFRRRLDGSYVALPGTKATLAEDSNAGHVLTFKNRTKYFFNNMGMLTKIETRNKNNVKLSYDDEGRLLNVISSSGIKLELNYDNNSRITKVIGPDSRVNQYFYDNTGNLIKMVNFLGDTIEYFYDENHRLTSLKDPIRRKAQIAYDTNGSLTSVRDPGGNTTTYDFISSGYNTSEDSKKIYFPNIITTTDALGNKTVATYNNLGNPLSITDQKGNKTIYQWDRFGNMTAVIDSLKNVIEFIYDEDSNLIGITDPLGNKAELLYDGKDQLIEFKDATRNKTEYQYDRNGNLIEAKDPSGGVTSLSYTPEGALEIYEDANENQTCFEHNRHGQVIVTTDAKDNTAKYEYADTGDVIKIIDQEGHQKEIKYDWQKRQKRILYPDGTESVYTYTKAGKLISAANQEGEIKIEYNELDMPIKVIDTNGQTIKYEYDTLGRRSKMIDSIGNITEYGYDEIGNLTSLTQPNGKKIEFEYDALGRRVKVLYPNNVQVDYRYDKAGNILGIINKNLLTGEIISYINYEYNSLGNCISKEEPKGQTIYKYDNLSRLIEVTEPDGDKITYTYDKVGNRLTQIINGVKEEYEYNELNQLLEHGDTTYAYDKKGNLRTKTEDAIATQYFYSPDNHLDQVIFPEGKEIEYTYDPFGRRISKFTPEGTTKFSYDIDDVVIELDEQNMPSVRYAHGPGIDDILGSQDLANSELSYFLHDNLGSITAILDQAGAVKDSFVYGPFGEVSSKFQNKITIPYLFTGRRFDSETNLYYYRFRYYAPEVGRFTTQDPIGLKGDSNLYAYCANNPVNFIDPSGEIIGPVGAVGGSIVGGIAGGITGGISGYQAGGWTGGLCGIGGGALAGAFAGAVGGSVTTALGGGIAGGIVGSIVGTVVGALVGPPTPAHGSPSDQGGMGAGLPEPITAVLASSGLMLLVFLKPKKKKR